MKSALAKRPSRKIVAPAVFAGTGLLCLILSIWTADAIERFSKLGVRRALVEAGHDWAGVEADGLQVILTGTAPSEAVRLRAIRAAGNVVDAQRITDAISVADEAGIAPPEFSLEILRNDDGISLIGLAPTAMDRAELVTELDGLAEGDQVTDMLESADHPVPETWDSSVRFAVAALKMLPRAKISLTPGRVAVTAISDSPAQKAQFESALRRAAPRDVTVALDISAPRPVIAPFTLRFLIDEAGARFDACSADSDRARRRILVAATEAGIEQNASCTVGLGVPTPEWADAVVMGIGAVRDLGKGSITFSDADVALIAAPDVAQPDFDRVVGELESNLPEVFSLKASLTPKSDGAQAGTVAEFVARLTAEGKVDLRGRLGDELTRDAVESFARARFGSEAVHAGTRLAENLPEGWSERVLVALEALGELTSGSVTVRAGSLTVEGVTGSQDARATVARILSSRLGDTAKFDLSIRYDPKLDPLLGLPTDQECVDQVNDILAAEKIPFEPGSAVIAPEAAGTLDKMAEVLKNCADYPIEIGGHTDSQGREEMNLALSDQRAKAVLTSLQTRRILTGNMTARGYGETVPLAPNNTEEGREQNRRIEFLLLSPQTAATGDGAAAEGDVAPAAAVQTPGEDTLRPKPRPSDLSTSN